MSYRLRHNNQNEEYAGNVKKSLDNSKIFVNQDCNIDFTKAVVMDFAMAFLKPLITSVRSTPTGTTGGLTTVVFADGVFGWAVEADGAGCCADLTA